MLTADPRANRRWIAGFAAAVLVTGMAALLVYLNAAGAMGRVWFPRNGAIGAVYLGVAAFMLAMMALALGVVELQVSRAAGGDLSVAPLAAKQPDPALELRPGETLTLVRAMRPAAYARHMARALALGLFVLIAYAGVSMVLIWLVFPTLPAGRHHGARRSALRDGWPGWRPPRWDPSPLWGSRVTRWSYDARTSWRTTRA